MPLLFICKTHCHFIDKITNHRIIAQRGDLFNFMITSDKSVWRIKTHASSLKHFNFTITKKWRHAALYYYI